MRVLKFSNGKKEIRLVVEDVLDNNSVNDEWKVTEEDPNEFLTTYFEMLHKQNAVSLNVKMNNENGLSFLEQVKGILDLDDEQYLL